MSNMFSIKNALDWLGFNNDITSDHQTIVSADGAILPGVGSFPEAMKHIQELDLIHTIKDFVTTGKPFMGICLGLQLLFTESEEFGHTAGLGIIEGTVKHFSDQKSVERVPHVGWNTIKLNREFRLTGSEYNPINHQYDDGYFYFVHSYFVNPSRSGDILTKTAYEGLDFCSAVLRKNVFACQFHPEKSGPRGLKLLTNFFTQVL